MGCFLGCFGRRKNRRRQRRRESFQPRINKISEGSTKEAHLNLRVPSVEEVPKSAKADHLNFSVHNVVEVSKISEKYAKDDLLDFRVPTVQDVPKVSVIPITDLCEEKHSPSPTRKRVTFDSKVKTYDHIPLQESIQLSEEKKEEKKPCSSEGSDITSNSSGSYPSNHRYQNCRESDDDYEEDEVTDCDESDLDDIDDDDGMLHEDYYSDDIYEDKIQNWDNKVYTEEIADNVLELEKINEEDIRGSNGNARDRSGYVNAVLNPIENLTQWKAVKSKRGTITTQTQSRKENSSLITEQEHKLNTSFSLDETTQVDELLPSFSTKLKRREETKKQRTEEVAVDASLSTWLSTSQTTTSGCSSVSMGIVTAMSEKKKYSKRVQSHDERPILCALTTEEIKQFSATNSPRRSPSKSPESPIIGTVGGYWNHHSMLTGNYREL